MIMLALTGQGLQSSLVRFASECQAAGMRINTSNSEVMVLHQTKLNCSLWVSGEPLIQLENFNYIGVLFTSERRMEPEIDRQIGATPVVMRSLHQSVVVKMEVC